MNWSLEMHAQVSLYLSFQEDVRILGKKVSQFLKPEMPSFSSPIFSAPFSHTRDIVLVHLPMGYNIQTSME